jgi:hypothetical protein
MANQTIQNSIDYSQTYIQYSPLNVGVANEPAITIANEVQNLVVGPPFTWGWNRKEDSTLSTVAGTQDYTVNLTDFAYLEKVSLTDPNGAVFEIVDVYNTAALGKADSSTNKRQRPNAACVLLVTYGTSVKIRFMGCPDVIYNVSLTYQKLVTPMAALTGGTGTWTIPPQYSDVYNSLFLAEALATVDDARAVQYRQRGVTALLAKSEGLSELQKNAFLEQYWMRDRQQQSGALRTQQSVQARGA